MSSTVPITLRPHYTGNLILVNSVGSGAAANAVQNPGFETGDFSYWSASGGGVSNMWVYEGEYSLYIFGSGEDSICQEISLSETISSPITISCWTRVTSYGGEFVLRGVLKGDGINEEHSNIITESTDGWTQVSLTIDSIPEGTSSCEIRLIHTSGYAYVFVDNVVCELETEQEINTKYIYAGNRLLAKEENGNLYFYHLDRIGSPIVITDEDGDVMKEKKYEAFGNLVWEEGTYDDNREFTSKEKDPTGFHYFGARYYSGDIGRFLSPDPHTVMPGNLNLKDPQTLNSYVYCTNNPLILIDPNGLQSFNPMVYYNSMTHEFESAVNQLINAGKTVVGLPGKAANDLIGAEVVSAASGSSGFGFAYTLTDAALKLEGGLTKAEAWGIAASFSASTGSAFIKIGTLTGPMSEGGGAILGYTLAGVFYGIAGGLEIFATKARIAEINGEIYIIWPREKEPVEEENLRLEFNPDDLDFNRDNNSHFNRGIDVNWDPFYFDPKRDNAGSCEYW
jgi:RHS repeat-associated protein